MESTITISRFHPLPEHFPFIKICGLTDPDNALRVTAVLPADIVPVAASGISCRQDIKTGVDAVIYNFLVGESIVRATDRKAFIHSLLQDA